MKFILGKKLNMTQVFKEDGTVVPVTKVQAGPCVVTQVKDEEKDGYKAVQFGYGEKKEKKMTKPLKGHLKGLQNFRYLREMRIPRMATNQKQIATNGDTNGHPEGEQIPYGAGKLKRGDKIDVGVFKEGDIVQITGTSKGKGFQGVVKRHGFHGSPASHGHKDQLRMPGSIGATGPAHVFKGKKMPGHMGNEQVTVKNLEIVKVDVDKGVLYIKGAVPGARNGLVEVAAGEGEMKPKIEDAKDKEDKKES